MNDKINLGLFYKAVEEKLGISAHLIEIEEEDLRSCSFRLILMIRDPRTLIYHVGTHSFYQETYDNMPTWDYSEHQLFLDIMLRSLKMALEQRYPGTESTDER